MAGIAAPGRSTVSKLITLDLADDRFARGSADDDRVVQAGHHGAARRIRVAGRSELRGVPEFLRLDVLKAEMFDKPGGKIHPVMLAYIMKGLVQRVGIAAFLVKDAGSVEGEPITIGLRHFRVLIEEIGRPYPKV